MRWRDASLLSWVTFPEPSDARTAARLRSEQFCAIIRHTPGMMLANICNALVVLVSLWSTPSFELAFLWASAVIALSVYVYRRHRRRRLSSPPAPPGPHVLGRAIVNAAILGSCWALLPLYFFHVTDAGGQILITCLSSGMLCGGAFALASIPAAALAFSAPIAIASFITLTGSQDPNHLLAAVVLTVYSAVLMRGVFSYGDQLRTRVLAQIDTERKAAERMEKVQSGKLSAIGGMATGLAHEINQPLAATLTYLETARRMLGSAGTQTVAVDAVMEKAANQALRAKEIVAHLREFILHGESEKMFVSLHQLIEDAVRDTGVDVNKAGVDVALRLEATEDRILADKVQIEQVLVNLIRNAADAMGVAPTRQLTIATSASEGLIKTDVIDTGPGISEAIRADLFQPFTTTKPGGMGVGLSISSSIVEAHRGEIWAHPNPNGGTVISFILPLENAKIAKSARAS